jgi:DNA-binding protein Fis
MVRQALELTKGNQVQAARLLGISRNTLRKKLGEDLQ